MKTILTIVIASLLSTSAFATPTVTSTMSGDIYVGTSVAAGLGQSVVQTATGGVSSFTVVGNGLASWKPYQVTEGAITTQIPGANCVKTALVASSITGAATESHSGNGFAFPALTWGGKDVNAIVNVSNHTVITELKVPVTKLNPLKCPTCN